jgi:hypothetical protein
MTNEFLIIIGSMALLITLFFGIMIWKMSKISKRFGYLEINREDNEKKWDELHKTFVDLLKEGK